MTAALFVALTLAVSLALVAAAWRWLDRRAAWIVSLGLPLWLVWVGTLSASGIVADPARRPPGIVWVFAPVLLFTVLFAVRSRSGGAVARAIPPGVLIGAQAFRVPVEIGLHRLGVDGLVPMLMTYAGGNVDILVGLSAPVMAWVQRTGRAGRGTLVAWNVLGLLALLNVVVRAVLTAPGPLRLLSAEAPNLAIGQFPYTFLAGLLAPVAVVLHVLSLRALRAPMA